MCKSIKAIICFFVILCLVGSQSAIAETIYYYHTDPVGTPLAMTDEAGGKVWEADYLPFGEVHTESGMLNDRKFVGKERDEESDLDYFGARFHYAKVGRFLAVDPVRAVDTGSGSAINLLLMNPQRQNVYVYSLNNSYRYFDPTGKIVQVTSHNVCGKKHTAVQMIPDDQSKNWGKLGFKKTNSGTWHATLSAGPGTSVEDYFLSKAGRLVSDMNRETDAPSKNNIEATVSNPYGKTAADDTRFIVDLIQSDLGFNDTTTNYDLPPLNSDGYNSNSYTSGLIKSVGADPPKVNNAPGYDKPVRME